MKVKYIIAIALVLVGCMMLRTQLIIGDDCKSMLSGLLFLFWGIMYFVIFLLGILYAKSMATLFKVTVFVSLGLLIVPPIAKNINGPLLLSAKSKNKSFLDLRKNGQFTAAIGFVDASCYYQGTYRFEGDSLFLLRDNLPELTDSLFCEAYFFEREQNLLRPIGKGDSLWLTYKHREFNHKKKHYDELENF
jgi:hypothetical protein